MRLALFEAIPNHGKPAGGDSPLFQINTASSLAERNIQLCPRLCQYVVVIFFFNAIECVISDTTVALTSCPRVSLNSLFDSTREQPTPFSSQGELEAAKKLYAKYAVMISVEEIWRPHGSKQNYSQMRAPPKNPTFPAAVYSFPSNTLWVSGLS